MYIYGFILMAAVIGSEAMKETINFIPILVGALVIIATFGITFYNMVRKSNQGWALNPVYHDPMKMEFNGKGFTCTTKNNMSRVTWQKVVKVEKSKKIIVIMLEGTQAYLIPTSIENIEEVKAVIRENLPAKTRGKYKNKRKG